MILSKVVTNNSVYSVNSVIRMKIFNALRNIASHCFAFAIRHSGGILVEYCYSIEPWSPFKLLFLMYKISASKATYIFIDVANLWEAQKSKRRLLDYQKLESYIKQRYSATQTKVFYYEAYPADGTRPYSLTSKHNFMYS